MVLLCGAQYNGKRFDSIVLVRLFTRLPPYLLHSRRVLFANVRYDEETGIHQTNTFKDHRLCFW